MSNTPKPWQLAKSLVQELCTFDHDAANPCISGSNISLLTFRINEAITTRASSSAGERIARLEAEAKTADMRLRRSERDVIEAEIAVLKEFASSAGEDAQVAQRLAEIRKQRAGNLAAWEVDGLGADDADFLLSLVDTARPVPHRWACACGWRGTPDQMTVSNTLRTCPDCGGSGGLMLDAATARPQATAAADKLAHGLIQEYADGDDPGRLRTAIAAALSTARQQGANAGYVAGLEAAAKADCHLCQIGTPLQFQDAGKVWIHTSERTERQTWNVCSATNIRALVTPSPTAPACYNADDSADRDNDPPSLANT